MIPPTMPALTPVIGAGSAGAREKTASTIPGEGATVAEAAMPHVVFDGPCA